MNDDDLDQREPEDDDKPPLGPEHPGDFLGQLRWHRKRVFIGTRRTPAWDLSDPVLQQWNGDYWDEIPTVVEGVQS